MLRTNFKINITRLNPHNIFRRLVDCNGVPELNDIETDGCVIVIQAKADDHLFGKLKFDLTELLIKNAGVFSSTHFSFNKTVLKNATRGSILVLDKPEFDVETIGFLCCPRSWNRIYIVISASVPVKVQQNTKYFFKY